MEEVAAQQHGKGKAKASESLDCQQCQDHGLECKLGPDKSTSCEECREAKVKSKHPGEVKPEQKWKQA